MAIFNTYSAIGLFLAIFVCHLLAGGGVLALKKPLVLSLILVSITAISFVGVSWLTGSFADGASAGLVFLMVLGVGAGHRLVFPGARWRSRRHRKR